MNIKHIFLTMVIGMTFTQITNAQNIQLIDIQPQLKEWFSSYATPCIAGGIIGSITGKLSSYITRRVLVLNSALPILIEDQTKQGIVSVFCLITIISTLVAENKIRTKCIDSLNQSFEKYGINHNNLTDNSAWLMSWVEFVK